MLIGFTHVEIHRCRTNKEPELLNNYAGACVWVTNSPYYLFDHEGFVSRKQLRDWPLKMNSVSFILNSVIFIKQNYEIKQYYSMKQYNTVQYYN